MIYFRAMQFLRNLQNAVREEEKMQALLQDAALAIFDAQAKLNLASQVIAGLERENLEWARRYRDLSWAFLLAHEQPDLDVREELRETITDLDRQIAVKEEHLV